MLGYNNNNFHMVFGRAQGVTRMHGGIVSIFIQIDLRSVQLLPYSISTN